MITPRWITGFAILLIAWLLGSGGAPAAAAVGYVVSEQGLYRAKFETHHTPLPLNRMHSWLISLETPDGQPLRYATFSMSGGMPAHDHGLASAPRMTRELDGGRYVVEGMKFHMSGRWIVVLQIAHELGDDTLVFEVDVE